MATKEKREREAAMEGAYPSPSPRPSWGWSGLLRVLEPKKAQRSPPPTSSAPEASSKPEL